MVSLDLKTVFAKARAFFLYIFCMYNILLQEYTSQSFKFRALTVKCTCVMVELMLTAGIFIFNIPG